MASVSLCPLHHTILPKHSFPCFNPQFQACLSAFSSRSPFRIRASSAVATEPVTSTQQNNAFEFEVFACPVCYEPLIRKGPPGLNLPAIYRSGFQCQRCNKKYSSRDIYLDLTVIAGTKEYTEFKPARTELFRSPLVSFLYERGWRQNFNRSGFPGPDEEFKMALEYFKPAEGGLLVDVSCGSGLFSRKFAESGTYSGVIALDFSENMLRQCYDFIKKDDNILNSNIALVRADVSRLPFSSGTVDAVHAGAALHCWPSPSNAVAEITRILRSGGIFVGTTFLAPRFGDSFRSEIYRNLRQLASNGYGYLTEKEIEDLCISCGLINYTSKVQQSFIMFSAQKA
ncbi:TPA_asm: hypothetical protein HUJ06_032021 [Nelumbo nucifera]|uniref:Methyltransferase type 11 domain-containing protein n=1 Tax=Nelumbo nucifera TaxID=4432 RepID=A0A822ZZ35_NELNU|nr:TPA_asm: hypothetical protein HUJ06_032021 [Nelumbo nucifera]